MILYYLFHLRRYFQFQSFSWILLVNPHTPPSSPTGSHDHVLKIYLINIRTSYDNHIEHIIIVKGGGGGGVPVGHPRDEYRQQSVV